MKSIWKLGVLVFGLLPAGLLFAQVTPEFQVGARGVMSVNTEKAHGQVSSAVNDFSDTGLLTGFRQKLYSRMRGQLVIGFQFPDADSDLGQLFFHQIFVRVEDKTNILKLGRSRVRSALIEFPTLRDDDALPFTDVLNPFSAGLNSEDNQYGNVAEFVHIFRQRLWIRLHGEHFTETPVPPQTAETDFSLNAVGLSAQYRVPETQLWNRPFLQQVGIGVNHFLLGKADTQNGKRILRNAIFSLIVNLRRDPVYFWDFRTQIIFNQGLPGVKSVSTYADLTRARSLAVFSSLRYLYRKLERPWLQLAFSAGYKTFPDLTEKSHQFQAVGNAFYRLGDNFDLAVQLQYRKVTGQLADLYSRDLFHFQIGFVYSINFAWNRQFDDRESLLNLEHGYIP